MKFKWLALALLVMLLTSSSATLAQDITPIEFGETATGQITNPGWQHDYSFVGEAGDLVLIDMRPLGDGFDTYLYLTTPANDILAYNDDWFGRASRIVYQLPNDGTYHVVATRYGERTGSGVGPYNLTVTKMTPVAEDITIEGTAESGAPPNTHPIQVETSGEYVITYRRIRGDYYPGMRLHQMTPESQYLEELGSLMGRGMRSGSMTMTLQAGTLYMVTLGDNNYDYVDSGMRAIYTLRVEAES